jgi:predicted anti-sigma-YlaC factor YlaD
VKLQLTCQQVSRLISDGQDQDLPPGERARVRLHFVICQHCRDIDEQVAFMRRAMNRLGRDEPPPGD